MPTKREKARHLRGEAPASRSVARAETVATKAGEKPQVGNVSFIRPEVEALKPQYEIVRDCLAGELTIKAKREKYLPVPDTSDDPTEKNSRYNAYLTRANFVNFTKRTMGGLIGTIFLRDPVAEIPDMLDFLKEDFTGSGISLDQCASMSAVQVLGLGRVGLFADYPNTQATATVEQVRSGKIRPSVVMYDAGQIINWRFVTIKGRTIPSLVVLFELVTVADDGYELKLEKQWRVLKLERQIGLADDVYYYAVETYSEAANGFLLKERFQPVDANGARLTEIPFQFIGVNNNDANPDEPPMYDLASVNVAHYRNSADYEEACFMVGQPTPWFAGLTEDWVKNVLKGKVLLGSRGAVLLPANASAGLLQAQENSMPKEAMEMKERQMVALGAKLVEQKQVQRTATEANQDQSADNSVLANVARNVAAGIVQTLKWCARFTGADENQIKYKLNTEFDLTQLAAPDQAQIISDWQSGAITTPEMRAAFRRGGIATLDDAEYAKQLKKDETDGTKPKDPQIEAAKVKLEGKNLNKPVAGTPPPA